MLKINRLGVASMMLMSVLPCFAYSGDETSTTDLLNFAIVCFIVLIISYKVNKDFKLNHLEYKGKCMWTLIVFPTWYTMNGVMNLICKLWTPTPYYYWTEKTDTMLTILSVICLIGTCIMWIKQMQLVIKFNANESKTLKRWVSYFWGWNVLFSLLSIMIMYSDSYFQLYDLPSKIIGLITFIIFTAISIVIYFAALRKIKQLSTPSKPLSSENTTVSNDSTSSVSNDSTPSDALERLTDLKRLLDCGVISSEEFTAMKKNIINKITG